MAERLGAALLELRTDDKGLTAGIARARGQAEALGKRFDRIGRDIARVGRNLTLYITGPLLGLGTLAARAFDTQIQAQQRLATAIRVTGGEVKTELAIFSEFASVLQSITTVGDEATLANIQVARSMGLSAAQSANAAKNAIALSRAFGINENSAIRYTAALEQGDTTMLNRYIPSLRAFKDETERAAEAQRILANAFQVAIAEAQSGLGPFRQMQNELGDLLEKFGLIVVEGINPFIQRLRQAIAWFASLGSETKESIVTVAALTAALGPAVVALGALVGAVGFAISGLTLLTTAAIPALITATARLGAALTLATIPILAGATTAFLVFALATGKTLDDIKADVEAFAVELKDKITGLLPKGLIDLIFNGGGTADPQSRKVDLGPTLDPIEAAMARVAELMKSLPTGAVASAAGLDGLADSAGQAADRIKEVIDALVAERDALGLSNTELRIAAALSQAGIDANHQMAASIRALVEEIEKGPGVLKSATKALADYASEAANIGKGIDSAITNAFRGAEDALVAFVTTGKRNFADLARSIVADLARIAIRATVLGPLAGALGGMFGGNFGTALAGALPKLQHGGSFTVGGMPGIDRNLVAFAATRGERVTVMPAGRDAAGAGGGGGFTFAPQTTINGSNTAEIKSMLDQRDKQLAALFRQSIVPAVRQGARQGKLR